MSNSPTPYPYYPALTGLRGVAALLVICFHYFDGLEIFRFGWLGTDVLFVLSGFLITGTLLQPRPYRWSRFALRRFLRIVPIYFLTLAAYFWLMPLASTAAVKQDIAQNAAYGGWYVTLTQNWLFVTDGYPAVPHLAFLWSLGVQAQFYVLMALLTLVTTRIKPLLLLCGALMLMGFVLRLNLRFETEGSAFTHYMYNTLSRLDSFMAGALVCLLLRQPLAAGRLRPFGFAGAVAALLLTAIFILRGTVNYRDMIISTAGMGLIAVAAACLLPLLVNGGSGRLNTLFTQQPLLFTGRISYGLYMYHVLIFTFVSNRLNGYVAGIVGGGLIAETITAVFCLMITYITAWLSYRFLEKRLLRIKH